MPNGMYGGLRGERNLPYSIRRVCGKEDGVYGRK